MFYPFKDISMGGSFMRPWGYPEIARLSDHPAGPNRRITGSRPRMTKARILWSLFGKPEKPL